jgi:hypothetical protein
MIIHCTGKSLETTSMLDATEFVLVCRPANAFTVRLHADDKIEAVVERADFADFTRADVSGQIASALANLEAHFGFTLVDSDGIEVPK